jgi:hypothetical protein
VTSARLGEWERLLRLQVEQERKAARRMRHFFMPGNRTAKVIRDAFI